MTFPTAHLTRPERRSVRRRGATFWRCGDNQSRPTQLDGFQLFRIGVRSAADRHAAMLDAARLGRAI
jgi:hypothetical protein